MRVRTGAAPATPLGAKPVGLPAAPSTDGLPSRNEWRRTGCSLPASGSTRRGALGREVSHQIFGHALDSGVGLEVRGFLDG